MKARPVAAGLKILNPKPPKTIFENTIANTIPIIRTCQGMVGGIIRAKIIAVTKTASLTGRFNRLVKLYSAMNATRQEIRTMASERQPKKYTEATMHGRVAIMTRRIKGCFDKIFAGAILNHSQHFP